MPIADFEVELLRSIGYTDEEIADITGESRGDGLPAQTTIDATPVPTTPTVDPPPDPVDDLALGPRHVPALHPDLVPQYDAIRLAARTGNRAAMLDLLQPLQAEWERRGFTPGSGGFG